MIKVVALDIYGTVLAFDDHDCSLPPRKGFEKFLDECDERGIKVVTSSDAFIGNVQLDLTIAFKCAKNLKTKQSDALRIGLSLKRFDNFFQLDQEVKDFSIIIGHYDILPSELLVIGDNPNKDIHGALILGANAVFCPAYGVEQGRHWDFSQINLDSVQ